MKKIGKSGLLLFVAAVCFMIFSLAGCNDEPTPGPDDTVKEKGSVTVMEPDGTVLKAQSGNEGDAFDFLPERAGYRSYGVYSDEDCTEEATLPTVLPKGEAVCYVRFENPISYSVSFSGGEGVGEMAGLSLVYGERTALPKNTFTYAGRAFSEWRLYAEDGSYSSFVDGARVKNLTTVDGASLTLVAVFETADSVNFTVADGVVTAYTGNAETVIFPYTGVRISAEVFSGNAAAASIKKIVVPSCYELIEQGAFAGCRSLSALTVPFIGGERDGDGFLAYLFGADSYKDNTYSFKANYSAYSGLTQADIKLDSQVVPTTLKTVTVTEPVYRIPEGAFYMVYGLEKLVIADYENLYDVGDSAFEGAWQLGYSTEFGTQNPLFWLENAESIGKNAFAAYITEENDEGSQYMFTRIFGLPKLEKIETIGEYAFYECVYITNLRFGGSLTSIGAWAFTNCASAAVISLPDSLASVGEYAFASCASVTELYFGKNLREIGSFAFAACGSLGSITVASASPAKTATVSISNDIDYKYNAAGQAEGYIPVFGPLTIYVPGEALATYRTAWADCAGVIVSGDTEVETLVYYDPQPDGSYRALLRIVGNLIYVTDPYGELLSELDYYGYATSLGTEYVLSAEAIGSATTGAVGSEYYLNVSNEAIVDYFDQPLKTAIRIRNEVCERDGVKYLVPEASVAYGNGNIGTSPNSLWKIYEDDYGHATLYHRETADGEWAEVEKPEGTVYTELYLYVVLAYTEQYLAVVNKDENGEITDYTYFFTLADADSGSGYDLQSLIPADGELTGTAMTFLSYGDIQLTLDGRGNAKVTYFESSGSYPGFVGDYTLTSGAYGDDELGITFGSLVGKDGRSISGTVLLDGFFDGGYHRCRVRLTEDGTVLYNDTVYPGGGLRDERCCINSADETRYTFYEYASEDGTREFFYATYKTAAGNVYHGTYELEGRNVGDKLTISIENYSVKTAYISDRRLSFTIKGALGDTEYKRYGYDEDYTFYMYEDFYGTQIDYYQISMDGYGNATLHDEHDDDIDIYYKGTYYNTGRSIGEDAYGVFWVYCFEGRECDKNGSLKKDGRTATYYYVTDTQVYEDDNYDYYGVILSISQSNGTTPYTVYDERGMKFAELEVDPFGITTVTLFDYHFENGEVVYTELTEKNANLKPVAYLDTAGIVHYIVVSDAAGNYLFVLAPDADGNWIYGAEHAIEPQPAPDTRILPDTDSLVRVA